MTHNNRPPSWHPESQPVGDLPGYDLHPDAVAQLESAARTARIIDLARRAGNKLIDFFNAPGASLYMPPVIEEDDSGQQ